MATETFPAEVSKQFPPELLMAVQRQAEENADAVAAFLHELARVLPLPEGTHLQDTYDSSYLLELGAVLWLLNWESAGISRAVEGLPRAERALRELTLSVAKKNVDPKTPLVRQLLKAFAKQFAWDISADFGQVAITSDFNAAQFGRAFAIFVFNNLHLLDRPQQ